MAENKYVLAMYDVRGKQEFIFNTDKLKEIVGASWVIRDIFDDYLFPVAKMYGETGKGIFNYKNAGEDETAAFSSNEFEKHIHEGYVGEVVYDGGGNFFVLFKDERTYKEITYRFTRKVMEEIGTLRILGICIEIDDFDDYPGDSRRLRERHSIAEARENMVAPWASLPIIQVDRNTSQPYINYTGNKQWKDLDRSVRERIKSDSSDGKFSRESFAKCRKYETTIHKYSSYDDRNSFVNKYYMSGEKIFDNLVAKRGEDSMLAVVYIDGNGMGAKVQNACVGKTNYNEYINSIRTFSNDIQKKYVEDGIKAALAINEDGMECDKSLLGHRLVVYAGDEVNFVVKAADALDCAIKYLNSLNIKDGESACAGIAVFHSHSPYSDAYRIAEECCESGKKLMKKKGIADACFVDFHLIQGAVGTSLDDIRKHEGTYDNISRPWRIDGPMQGKDSMITQYSEIKKVAALLRMIGRSNIKNLASTARAGWSELAMELNRISAHASGQKAAEIRNQIKELINNGNKNNDGADHIRRLIYDIVIAYDLWFDRDNGEDEHYEQTI